MILLIFGEYLLFESAVVIRHSHAYYQLAMRCTLVELQYLLFDGFCCFVFQRAIRQCLPTNQALAKKINAADIEEEIGGLETHGSVPTVYAYI